MSIFQPGPQKLPTIKLKDPKTGATRVITRMEYVRRAAKYSSWLVVGWKDVGVTQQGVDGFVAELTAEEKRLAKPGHISQGDERRAYEGRIIHVTGETADAIAAQARVRA